MERSVFIIISSKIHKDSMLINLDTISLKKDLYSEIIFLIHLLNLRTIYKVYNIHINNFLMLKFLNINLDII